MKKILEFLASDGSLLVDLANGAKLVSKSYSVVGGAGIKPAKPFMTSDGPRYVDRLLNEIEHESKARTDVKLTNSAQRKKLIDEGIVKGAHWHFWQGASREVLDTSTSLGIKFTVH